MYGTWPNDERKPRRDILFLIGGPLLIFCAFLMYQYIYAPRASVTTVADLYNLVPGSRVVLQGSISRQTETIRPEFPFVASNGRRWGLLTGWRITHRSAPQLIVTTCYFYLLILGVEWVYVVMKTSILKQACRVTVFT